MKTYHESSEMILKKIAILKKRRRKRQIITVSFLAVFLMLFALILFWPHKYVDKDTVIRANDPRYPLIQKLNYATGRGKLYKNNYEKWTDGLFKRVKYAPLDLNYDDLYDPNEDRYVQFTTQQDESVTQGDLVQYSDEYIFSLNGGILYAYTVNGENSKQVGAYPLSLQEENMHTDWHMDETVMYLTENADAVILVGKAQYESQKNVYEDYVFVQKLNVSDPANITAEKTFYITGFADNIAQSARMIDGKLFLTVEFKIENDWDASKEETYLPRMGSFDQQRCVDLNDVYMSEYALETHYSVVAMLDMKTMQVMDSAALLSGSKDIYISSQHVYMLCSYARAETGVAVCALTDIVALGHGGGRLEHESDIQVPGYLLFGTGLREHNGMLYMFAQTGEITVAYGELYNVVGKEISEGNHLYCISTENWEVKSVLERFLPIGEEILSIRYEADIVYICSENFQGRYKVYVIDLSDAEHITCDRAGTWPEYPTSVMEFADAHTLGICIKGQEKVCVQIFNGDTVDPTLCCSYELGHVLVPASAKSYTVSAESQTIAIPMYGLSESQNIAVGTQVCLLRFDGNDLQMLRQIPLKGDVKYMRTVQIGDYLYLIGDEFKVEKLQ